METVIAGLRACLFVVSVMCMWGFTPMTIEAASFVKQRQTPPLAYQFSFGIWLLAFGGMSFSAHRLYEAIFFSRNPISAASGWDAFWLLISLAVMCFGFFMCGIAKAGAVRKGFFIYTGGLAVVGAGLFFAILASLMAR